MVAQIKYLTPFILLFPHMNFQHIPQNHPTPKIASNQIPLFQNLGPRQQAPQSLLFRNQSEAFNQKRMKQLVQEIRFKQKMQAINRKKGKYKRSTNNCHKKYIGILKNLLFLKLNTDKKDYILSQYNQFRNSRVYYFIILQYLKWSLDIMDIRWIFQHFCQEVQGKINRYKLEINTTSNSNFIHFRKDEIIQMEYSIQSINYFLRGDYQQAIRVLYQKNKYIIIKRNEYLRTLQIIKSLEGLLKTQYRNINIEQKLEALNLHEVFHWNKVINFEEIQSIQKINKKKRRENQEQQESQKESQEILHEKNKQDLKEIPIQNKFYQNYIKEQEKSYQQEEKYPLMKLENSYKMITDLHWHSWIIQKQKTLEFQMRNKEEQIRKAALTFGCSLQPSNFTKFSQIL